MMELVTTIIMAVVLVLFCVFAAITLRNIHNDPQKPDLLDLITATDKSGHTRFDARKCWEAGAFSVSTWAFVYIVMANRLTEWFFAIYMGSWVAARFLRDREQRLNLPAPAPAKPAKPNEPDGPTRP